MLIDGVGEGVTGVTDLGVKGEVVLGASYEDTDLGDQPPGLCESSSRSSKKDEIRYKLCGNMLG